MTIIHRCKRLILKLYIRRMRLPEFHDTGLIRQRITYTGKVQRVGFRDEMKFIAVRVSVTGNVRNIGDHTVVAELQGPPDRIDALKQVILNEKRFGIESAEEETLDPIPGESEFSIVG